ncbi:hypothetical protein SASPL_116672 [Salvia splendens]|uniref:Large ribosomal subunit protein mL45 n=1 Tax=Salvia splendens TaxID=180675 RepID=A0A8X8XY92_SALSN|nr:hypothetical protein SASPL_116672 [Salvia splendens]
MARSLAQVLSLSLDCVMAPYSDTSDAFAVVLRAIVGAFSFSAEIINISASNQFHELPEVKSPGISCLRFFSAQAAATTPPSSPARTPAQSGKSAAVKLSITSPGVVGDPYSPSEPISFWRRCFTRSGQKRTKEEFTSQLKSMYAIAQVRKKYGHSKKKFYEESVYLYQEINTLMANGDKKSLRKFVTEHMYSTLKNEIKHRDWVHVHWELIMPIVKIRTLRARLIGTDKNDVMKSFAQITIEIFSKQKFEAYDSNGAVVSGDKEKEVYSCTRYMGLGEISLPSRILLASLWKNQGVIVCPLAADLLLNFVNKQGSHFLKFTMEAPSSQ